MEMVSFEFQVLASLSAAIFMLFKFRSYLPCARDLLPLFRASPVGSADDLNGTGASDLNAARAIPAISEENAKKTDENSWEVFRT
jgi:hypothetical protein